MEYKEEFNEQAYKLCKTLDIIDTQLAGFFKISLNNLYQWCNKYPSFLGSIEKGLKDHTEYLIEAEARKVKRREYKKTVQQRNSANIYMKNRFKTNIQHKIRNNMGRLIRDRLVKKTKKGSFRNMDYTVKELKEHLEKQFDDKMNWDNYGSYWHVDHIVPDSWFTYETENDEQFKQAWALSNLQPLSAKENIRKGNRYAG